MKKLSLLFLSVLTISTQAQSPISITSANMPVSGDTIRYSNASLGTVGDYTITGANHTWDFSQLDSTGQSMRKFEPASATAYAFYFGSGYGEKITDSIGAGTFTFKNIYSFYKNKTAGFYVDGIGLTFSGFAAPVFYSKKDTLYKFPLNYLDRDSTVFKFSTPATGTIPSYSKQGYRITEADGWGTIITPYGTQPCLRVVTTQYSQDSVKGTLALGTFTLPLNTGLPNYVRSYQWLTLTEKIPYLEVSGQVIGNNFTPNQVRYRDFPHAFVGIKEDNAPLALSVFPNPTKDKLTIIITQQQTSVVANISDMQGKIVKTQVLDQNSQAVNQHQLDVSELAKGLYILNLSGPKGKQSIKISIQ